MKRHPAGGLHLTVRTSTPAIDKRLDALLAIASDTEWAKGTTATAAAEEQLRGLPFAPADRLTLCTKPSFLNLQLLHKAL
ncbi:MAG: hypothetical protein KFF68_08405 [Desulfosarcina sp.]|nr:hypothetical protein [Desulfosarcina sp.]